MGQSIKRVILTGAPSTGKTSVLNYFKQLGYPVYSEIAREVIKKSLANNSNKVPWIDLVGFSNEVAHLQLKQHNLPTSPLNFFDRGLPDVIAYLNNSNIETSQLIKSYLDDINYHPKVFLFPYWEEIYFNDEERKESFNEAIKIENHIINTYNNLNYSIIKVPKLPINERCDFILKSLEISNE